MKAINFILVFLLIYSNIQSQVTFTKDDVLEIGCTVVYQYLDSAYLESLVLDKEGGPHEWDFTDVVDGIY
jgi:hypothetical protein